MTNLYDLDKRLNTCSSSEWQASVRSVKLRSTTLCTGVFLFYIKRHLMSGNEFACSLGSSSAKIAWVWTQKTRWKTLANNVRRYSSRCVRAFRLRTSSTVCFIILCCCLYANKGLNCGSQLPLKQTNPWVTCRKGLWVLSTPHLSLSLCAWPFIISLRL